MRKLTSLTPSIRFTFPFGSQEKDCRPYENYATRFVCFASFFVFLYSALIDFPSWTFLPVSRISMSPKLRSSSPMSYSSTPEPSPCPVGSQSGASDFASLPDLVSSVTIPEWFDSALLLPRSRHLHRQIDFIHSEAGALASRNPSQDVPHADVAHALAERASIPAARWIEYMVFYNIEQRLGLQDYVTFYRQFVAGGGGIDPPLTFWKAQIRHAAVMLQGRCKCSEGGDKICKVLTGLVIFYSYKPGPAEEGLVQLPRENGKKSDWKEFEKFWNKKGREKGWKVDWDLFRVAKGTESWSVGLKSPRGGTRWLGTV